MCEVNMTFHVPESTSIDIDALKKQMQAYFNLALSFPSILKKEPTNEEQYTQQMLDRFAGAWHGEESADDIIASIKDGRGIREPLSL